MERQEGATEERGGREGGREKGNMICYGVQRYMYLYCL